MKVLVLKDELHNKIVSTQLLHESDNIKYSIIDNAPVIEEKEGMIGKYELDETGQLIVVYEPKPKTEIELINEKLDIILGTTTQAVDDGLINMDLLIMQDDKLTQIEDKLQ